MNDQLEKFEMWCEHEYGTVLFEGEIDLCWRGWQAAIASQWQTIESAPKDGTSILVFTKEGICEVVWDRDEWLPVPCYSTYDGAGCAKLCCQPTHWTHLPPNPTE